MEYSPKASQKNNVDWQEQSDGSWNAITTNYKLVAYKKDDETIANSESFKQYTHQSLLYKWDEREQVWVLVDKAMFGERSMEDARIGAERLLGSALRPPTPPQPYGGPNGSWPDNPFVDSPSAGDRLLMKSLLEAMMKGKSKDDPK